MSIKQGDRVRVRGCRDKEGVLRVWEVRPRGLVLTTEQGYKRLLAGDEDAPQVGYPDADVLGLEAPMLYEVFEDREAPGDWRVEAFGESGECCIAVFAGNDAEQRARDYAGWVSNAA